MQTIPSAITFLVECWRIRRTFPKRVLQCQTVDRIIAGPAGSITAIAAFGETLRRMKPKPHSARYAASPCWLTTGLTARTGTRVATNRSARSTLQAFMKAVIDAFLGMDLLLQSSSRSACVASVGHPSMMGYPFPPWKAHPSPSAATCITCNGGNGNIRTKKLP